MKAIKGMIKYMGIVLLALILIGALLVGMMFLMKINLFGYYFLKVDKGITFSVIDLSSEEVYGSNSNFTVVELNIVSNNYGVRITPTDSTNISFKAVSDYIGFVSEQPTEPEGVLLSSKVERINSANAIDQCTYPSVCRSISSEGGRLQITLNFGEPNGAISFSDSSMIYVNVPYMINERVINYSIDITTGNGDIELTNSFNEKNELKEPLVISSMNLTTRKGDCRLRGIGDSSGKETDVLELQALNINTNGGTFDFSGFSKVVVKDRVVLNSENATYKFSTLQSYNRSTVDSNVYEGGVGIMGKDVKFEANIVYCGSDGFGYKSETGVLKINRLYSGIIDETIEEIKDEKGEKVIEINRRINGAIPYENTIFSDSAEIELGIVVGKLGLYNEYGNVSINYLTHQASMRTENGNIIINKSGVYPNEIDDEPTPVYSSTSALILYSTYGNIQVNEYYQDAVVYSKKGKINLHSYYNNVREDRYFYTDISTKDGEITAITEKNPIVISASDNATINLKVNDLLDTKIGEKNMNPFENYMYSASSKNGNVNVVLPMKSYMVNVSAKKIAGSIGATSVFGENDIQISAFKENQPSIKISGRNVTLSSLV